MAIPHVCPACNGQGLVSRPSYVAGDQTAWTSDKTTHSCPACKGTGVVWENNEKEYVYPEDVYISLKEWRQ